MMNGGVGLRPITINGGVHYVNQAEEDYDDDGFELHEEGGWTGEHDIPLEVRPKIVDEYRPTCKRQSMVGTVIP